MAPGTRDEGVPGAAEGRKGLRGAVDGYVLGVAAISAGLAAFLLLRLHALPPHEDETLVFFVSHGSFTDMLGTVLGERGGAPLHYLLAWLAGLVDPGLTSLRLISVAFAVASMPVIAALVARLSDRRTALVATLLAAASWTTLYHGIYARMYSLFLFTAVLSLLLLLRALAHGSRGRWAAWVAATLALVATQPYGVLVLAAEVVFVGVQRLRGPLPLRRPLVALAAVLVLATPLWRTYALLASRFDVGVGVGSSELGSPFDVVRYLGEVFGDFTAGRLVAGIPAALLGTVGLVVLARRRPETAILTGIVAGVPALALLAAGSGPGVSLETRHLIFLLPFVTMAIAAGVLQDRVGGGPRRARRGGDPPRVPPRLAGRLGDRPDALALYRRARGASGRAGRGRALAGRVRRARTTCSSATSRPTWTPGTKEPRTARSSSRGPTLASPSRRSRTPASRSGGASGCWTPRTTSTMAEARLTIPEGSPGPAFETAAFGPFLVVRTVDPTITPATFLQATLEVQALAAELGIGDAGRNAQTAAGGAGAARSRLADALAARLALDELLVAGGLLERGEARRRLPLPRLRPHLHPPRRGDAGDRADEPAEEEGPEPSAPVRRPRGRL